MTSASGRGWAAFVLGGDTSLQWPLVRMVQALSLSLDCSNKLPSHL